MHSVPSRTTSRALDSDLVWRLCERLQGLGLDHQDLGLLVHLLSFTRRSGIFSASLERLARAVGRDRSTISRRLQRLVDLGLVRRVAVHRPGHAAARLGYDLHPLAAALAETPRPTARAPRAAGRPAPPADAPEQEALKPAPAAAETGATAAATERDGGDPAGLRPAGAPPDDPTRLDQLWTRVLDLVQLQVAPSVFDTWLAETRLVAGGDGRYQVVVGSPAAAAAVAERFGRLLRRALERALGQTVNLTVTAAPARGAEGTAGPVAPVQQDAPARPSRRALELEAPPPGDRDFESSAVRERTVADRCLGRSAGAGGGAPAGGESPWLGGSPVGATVDDATVEERLRQVMRQLSAELHDEPGSRRASETRLLRLWAAHGGRLEAFLALVDEARAAARRASIRLVRSSREGPVANRVPYFFAVLENAVRGRRPAATAAGRGAARQDPRGTWRWERRRLAAR